MNAIRSPDENTKSLHDTVPDALRYDGHTDDPAEVAGLMRAAMPEGVRVLDVGCGTGSLTQIVNHGKGNQVLGLEPDLARAAEARKRGLNVVTDALDGTFMAKYGPFDVVIFADVLEHLPAPGEMLETAVRALAPGGFVLISVPNVAHWSVRANLLLGRFDYELVGIMDATHLRWFTDKSIRAFVQRAGLEVVSIRQAAGVTLPVYGRSIFRLVPFRVLKPTVRLLARLMPRMFGSQHVILARKPEK